jgi:N-acetylneuraminate synthase
LKISNDRIFVIAEAGINHNGDIKIAKDLMLLAKSAGCDAVKFQKRTPEICVPHDMRNVIRQTPWGEMTYLEYKEKIEFGENEYDEIDRYAKDIDIQWSASAWDLESLSFLEKYKLPFHKIASALATNIEFIQAVAKSGILTIASTGMCTWEEIDRLVSIFEVEKCPLILMHTISTYPAEEKDLNLKLIQTLAHRYNIPIGYSGHERSVSPSITAAALGAIAIERHITLDRAMWGTDHAASLEPAGLINLVGALRKIPQSLGDGIRRVVPGEIEIAKKLRYWE